MKIPKQLNIAGHTINVVHKDGLIFESQECWGLYDDDKHTIYLKKGMEKTRKMEILLHEALHAIDHIHVLNLSEKAVKTLGVEILALIRNNRINLLERRTPAK
jgi:hypothetical protein